MTGNDTDRLAIPDSFVTFAHHLADLSAAMLREQAQGEVAIEIKPDGTPVTSADKAVEAALRREIETSHPEHGIIGEEFPARRADAEWVWVIDPLDGTKEFIQGLPLWGSLLALAWRGRFVLGVAEQPLLGERWIGVEGQGTRRNGKKLRTRPCASLDQAVVSTMGYDSFCPARYDTLRAVRGAARGTVIADSFFVFGLLAAGRVDLIVSDGFALHDYAALDVIVREAGGSMTDWGGRRLGLNSDRSVIAAGDARLWQAVREGLPSAGTAPR